MVLPTPQSRVPPTCQIFTRCCRVTNDGKVSHISQSVKTVEAFSSSLAEYLLIFVALGKGNVILIVTSSKLEAVAVKFSAFRSLVRRALNNEAS